MKHLLSSIALVGMLSGCATSGANFDIGQANALTVGQSTEADVVRVMGKPSGVSDIMGMHSLIYSYAHVETNPAALIPFVGLAFAGDTRTTTKAAAFVFSADGLLHDKTTSGFQVGTGFYR